MESAIATKLPLAFSSSASKPLLHSFALASLSFPSFGGGGGGRFFFGGGGGGMGGGDDAAGAGSAAAAATAALGDAAVDSDSEVILLHVGGMSCGGCAAKVKRILESQPEVTSATIDFETATATVWTTPEVKATKDWQKQLGEKLANHLTTCGFQSHLQEEEQDKQN